MTAGRYRFIPREPHERASSSMFVPDPAQQRVLAHRSGPLLVTGGPGTGKTTTLIEAVAQRVNNGVPPQQLLVFGFGRRGSGSIRRQISARLNRTGAEVPVYSFAAYAFAILRLMAQAEGTPPPSLLSGPEQDVVIRQLLADNIVEWPESIQPALETHAFVSQLRDLILRATERGVSAPALAALGRRHNRPEWVSAAAFMERYVDVLALISQTGSATFDTAEIIRAAVSALRDNPTLIDVPEHVYVDELQETDPASIELLRLICGQGGNLTAFGDADSAIFAFRGADASVLRRFGELFPSRRGTTTPVIRLTTCYRSAESIVESTNAIAARLPGGPRQDHRVASIGVDKGTTDAVVLRSITSQAAYITHKLRSAHLHDQVRWSNMAVIVKSSNELAAIERALRHARVPVTVDIDDKALSSQPVVAHLLAIIQHGLDPKSLDEETAVALLHSPYGGADSLSERRLRQALQKQAVADGSFRPTGELLVDALREPSLLVRLPDEPWADPPRRIAGLMECARDTTGTVEEILWQVWHRSALSSRLARRAVSRDSRAWDADASLDAMMTLFDWAAKFTDKLPGASCEVFVSHVLQQRLPADSLAAHARRGDSVSLLTAHAAKGRQWDLVVIAGLQEGAWPNLRPRGSVMGAEFLVEALASEAANIVDPIKILLDEERRLFYVAAARARDHLLVTAVSDDDEDVPSRFMDDLGVEIVVTDTPPAPLSLPSLVAALRRAASGPDDARREDAVKLLAQLARKGVPGAHPSQWWGLTGVSDDRPIVDAGGELRLSPSALDLADQCGLRWLLERHGGSDSSSVTQQIGMLVHSAIENLPTDGDTLARMRDYLNQYLEKMPSDAPWRTVQVHDRVDAMASSFVEWLDKNDNTFIAAERGFSVRMPIPDSSVTAVLAGKVDRLERDFLGRVRIVDVKTGKQALRHSEVKTNLQLAAYQLAVADGQFHEVTNSTTSAGAALVYIGTKSKKASVIDQPPFAETSDPDWAKRQIADVAGRLTSPTFQAVHSSRCSSCGVAQCCPISPKGKSVTE